MSKEVVYRLTTKYASCQLDAAINAAIFLGKDIVTDDLFELLVDQTSCRYGPVINIHPALRVLGLQLIKGSWRLSWVKNNLPVVVGYNDPKHGYHGALVVDVIDRSVVMVNAAFETILWRHLLEKRIPAQHVVPFSYRLVR